MAEDLESQEKQILARIRHRTERGLGTCWRDVRGHCGRFAFYCKPDTCEFYVTRERQDIVKALRKLEAGGLVYRDGYAFRRGIKWYAAL